VRAVSTLLLSLTVLPPASPVTPAVFVTTDGLQSSGATVFFEHEYVQTSPWSRVRGVSSAPAASALPTSAGGSSQLGSVTVTDDAGNEMWPELLTKSWYRRVSPAVALAGPTLSIAIAGEPRRTLRKVQTASCPDRSLRSA
jgi:hypothetical protein